MHGWYSIDERMLVCTNNAVPVGNRKCETGKRAQKLETHDGAEKLDNFNYECHEQIDKSFPYMRTGLPLVDSYKTCYILIFKSG